VQRLIARVQTILAKVQGISCGDVAEDLAKVQEHEPGFPEWLRSRCPTAVEGPRRCRFLVSPLASWNPKRVAEGLKPLSRYNRQANALLPNGRAVSRPAILAKVQTLMWLAQKIATPELGSNHRSPWGCFPYWRSKRSIASPTSA
jgi:hypothetical protein